MKQSLKRVAHGLARLLAPMGVAAGLLSVAGCDGFFVKPTSGGTTPGTTGSYLYASNPATSATGLAAYSLASGTLVAVAGSPFALGFSPSALSVVPGNAFLYAATNSALYTGIYVYTISTATGALAIGNSGTAVAALNVAAMDISPDGKYLLALNSDGSTMTEYSINAASGALTFAATVTYAVSTGTVVTPSAVKVAPSGSFIVCALGTAGDIIFPYSNGMINAGYVSVPTGSSSVGDYSVALDASNVMYVARTSGLAVYTLSSAGVPTAVTGSPFAAGAAPRSVVVFNGYAYAANQGSGTISAYSVSGTGALTGLVGSPYTSASTTSALGVDKSGKYLLALGYDSSAGLRIYAFGSGGALTSTGSTVATGIVTTVPAVMALTR